MKAYRLIKWKSDGELVDVPIPEPGVGHVLLKVGGNGICQSDLHAMDIWEDCPPHLDIQLPMTMGHEVAGWIEACGPGVVGFDIGLPCLVTISGCGQCRHCAQGWNNYCLKKGKQVGFGLDGGLAEFTVVPASGIVPLRSLEPWQAAPLTDAGLSSYHAAKRVLPLLMPGSTIVVIGIGGLGHMAVSILKAISPARIIAVDISGQALSLAEDLGADLTLYSDETTATAIQKDTEGGGVEAVLDFVGAGESMSLAAHVIRPLGHIVVIGRGQGIFPFKDRALPYGAIMSTTFGGSKLELQELVALAEAGKIKARIAKFPLCDVQTAFNKMRCAGIVGRAVIVPEGH